jgi:hypothetical protein
VCRPDYGSNRSDDSGDDVTRPTSPTRAMRPKCSNSAFPSRQAGAVLAPRHRPGLETPSSASVESWPHELLPASRRPQVWGPVRSLFVGLARLTLQSRKIFSFSDNTPVTSIVKQNPRQCRGHALARQRQAMRALRYKTLGPSVGKDRETIMTTLRAGYHVRCHSQASPGLPRLQHSPNGVLPQGCRRISGCRWPIARDG